MKLREVDERVNSLFHGGREKLSVRKFCGFLSFAKYLAHPLPR